MAASVCCDTSFLISLFLRDTHSTRAHATLRGLGQSVAVSTLNEFEFLNAVRLFAFRKLIPLANINTAIAAFRSDLAGTGRLRMLPLDLGAAVEKAKDFSDRYTPTYGDRSFDILHVAVALVAGADGFLSFDAKQRTLATAEGLAVMP